MNIGNIEVCQPLVNLVEFLINQGARVVEKRVHDYHFREIYVKMNGVGFEGVSVAGIGKVKPNRYVCECHWSTVEIVEK